MADGRLAGWQDTQRDSKRAGGDVCRQSRGGQHACTDGQVLLRAGAVTSHITAFVAVLRRALPTAHVSTRARLRWALGSGLSCPAVPAAALPAVRDSIGHMPTRPSPLMLRPTQLAPA